MIPLGAICFPQRLFSRTYTYGQTLSHINTLIDKARVASGAKAH